LKRDLVMFMVFIDLSKIIIDPQFCGHIMLWVCCPQSINTMVSMP